MTTTSSQSWPRARRRDLDSDRAARCAGGHDPRRGGADGRVDDRGDQRSSDARRPAAQRDRPRAACLSNDLDAQLDGIAPSERLAAVARWSCTTTGDDRLLRQLFVEVLARSTSDSLLTAAVRADAREHRKALESDARLAGAPHPDFVADVLHLVLRGFYLATIEDSEEWTSERVTPVIDALVRSDAGARPDG
jgi:hypothetical protein